MYGRTALRGAADHPALAAARTLFERRWSNADGRLFSLPYTAYQDDSAWRKGLYRVMEFTGWSTF